MANKKKELSSNNTVGLLQNLITSEAVNIEKNDDITETNISEKEQLVKPIIFSTEKKEKKVAKSFSLSERYARLIEITAKANKISEVKALELMLEKLINSEG